jgi:UDP-glucose 4-epimerase
MKVIVIGATGFIGRHCIHYLQQKQYEVSGADIVPVDITPVGFLLDKHNTDFSKIFSENSFDVCINASGAASVPFSLETPQLDFELNTGNVVKILEALRKFNPGCFFINFSSAAIYGNPETLPVTESMTAAPMSPYGWHKHYAEQICKEYALFFNIKVCNLRVFSAYGPGLKKQFFWDLYHKLQKQQEVELFGTGNESRDFIYVDDIVKCVELIIENRDSLPDNINVASGVETSISEAAQVFAELLSTGNKIRFGGEIRVGDPLNWKADINILRSIGFNPSYTLIQGLEEYILWLQNEKK